MVYSIHRNTATLLAMIQPPQKSVFEGGRIIANTVVTHFNPVLQLCEKQSTDLHWKLLNWFLYNCNTRLEWVKNCKKNSYFSRPPLNCHFSYLQKEDSKMTFSNNENQRKWMEYPLFSSYFKIKQ